MNESHWYVILGEQEVLPNKLVYVVRLSQELVLFRDASNQVVALSNRCPHRGASLAHGRLSAKKEVVCPFHGFRFDASGKVTVIPANGESEAAPKHMMTKSWPIRVAHGFIWMWYGPEVSEYPEIPWFDNLDEKMPYRQSMHLWECHYSRCIENQLDFEHVAFVHKKTIGRGNKTVVHMPAIQLHELGFKTYAQMEKEAGQVVNTKEEPKNHDFSRFHLEFLWPNLWQNYLYNQARVMLAFVPVDDHNTMIYMRYYQELPVVGALARHIGLIYSKKILKEDHDVVITQKPDQSSYRMGEHLLAQESPIILYRKERERRELY